MIELFFSLLRSGMYGLPIPADELPEHIDWAAVGHIARKHAVGGIIIESVPLLPDALRPQGETAAKMSRFALKLLHHNILLDRTAARLVEFLKGYGIEGVLLKGPGVARYYRQPQMRISGDIDFYVGQDCYRRASELCQKHLMNDAPPLEETEKHFSFRFEGVVVELHRIATRIYSPFRRKRFQEWLAYELEQSPARRKLLVGETEIFLPSYDFDAIFIFYHAWRHFITGGIGVRQLCDWAMIFHSHGREIDMARLEENIRRFGMTAGWKLFACIAVHHLGVPACEMPLYDPKFIRRSEKVLREILDGGNFGYYSDAYIRSQSYGRVRQKLSKFRSAVGYWLSLLPLMPVEATFLFFSRIAKGIKG